jgi:hypothetical protein
VKNMALAETLKSRLQVLRKQDDGTSTGGSVPKKNSMDRGLELTNEGTLVDKGIYLYGKGQNSPTYEEAKLGKVRREQQDDKQQ